MPVTTDSTAVEADRVVFRLPDPGPEITGVRLWSEVPVEGHTFERVEGGGWELPVAWPGAHRIEYLFQVNDGTDRLSILDPTNPLRVEGVFGDHSWLPMPGYFEPPWLIAPRIEAQLQAWSLATRDGAITGSLWAPAQSWRGAQLPLLICHDGTEMARFGRLTDFIATAIAQETLPPLRILLLDPGPHRNHRYAANSRYADALVKEVLPAVAAEVGVAGKPVLMGQSMGGLAALHAARRAPGTFAALFLQSGSFFTPRFDPQESGYSHWAQVTGFTSTLYRNPAPERLPLMFVCGSQEENYANNVALSHHLAAHGGNVGWGEVPDGHTWTTWRDLLDPHLTRLLAEAWN